jgi:hypothetical protein
MPRIEPPPAETGPEFADLPENSKTRMGFLRTLAEGRRDAVAAVLNSRERRNRAMINSPIEQGENQWRSKTR